MARVRKRGVLLATIYICTSM